MDKKISWKKIPEKIGPGLKIFLAQKKNPDKNSARIEISLRGDGQDNKTFGKIPKKNPENWAGVEKMLELPGVIF